MQRRDSTREFTALDNFIQELHKEYTTDPVGVQPAGNRNMVP